MVIKHPIVAVTGASGSGTTVVQQAFKAIFYRQGIHAVFVHGDSFLKHSADDMRKEEDDVGRKSQSLSCYGPDLNDFDALEALFKNYSEKGKGRCREIIKDENAAEFNLPSDSFTDWSDVPEKSDLLFYEGMHGGVVASTWTRRKMSESHNKWVQRERRNEARETGIDVAKHVDLLIGVVPAINLEWIQKIHSDMRYSKKSTEEVTAIILSRLQDYIHFIVPQFSITDINFQRMPIVDTSNPFIARDVPTESESIIVIRFREPGKYNFPHLLKRIDGSFMSRANTMVIPGGEMQHALDIICAPIIEAYCGIQGTADIDF